MEKQCCKNCKNFINTETLKLSKVDFPYQCMELHIVLESPSETICDFYLRKRAEDNPYNFRKIS